MVRHWAAFVWGGTSFIAYWILGVMAVLESEIEVGVLR